MFGYNLAGYVTPELGVMSLIQLAHSACADLGGDLVGVELCACGYWHRDESAEFTQSRAEK